MQSYNQIIEYLYNSLPVFQHVGGDAYKPGLDRSHKLDNFDGNPHKKFIAIHIAGTNGKGSVSHMLASIFQEAGYKTGLYTSPHLVDFRERIRINGDMITEQYVVDYVTNRKSLFDTINPSFFEMTVAMAFNYFADQHVDIAIVETGMGGRLDSTNIITPILSIITNIGKDHCAFLGNTLGEIAFEKAGIIKPNLPVIIGETHAETRAVFENVALRVGANLVFADNLLSGYQIADSVENKNVRTVTLTKNEKIRLFQTDLCGIYQSFNIRTVACALDTLSHLNLPTEAIHRGLRNVQRNTNLMGRWQLYSTKPRIILDTGHNAHGITQVVRQLKTEKYKTLRIVFGTVNDKPAADVLELLPTDAIYYFTQAKIARALDVKLLQNQSVKYRLANTDHTTVAEAVKAAIADAQTDDLIFIGGSNFVVGEALEFLNEREKGIVT